MSQPPSEPPPASPGPPAAGGHGGPGVEPLQRVPVLALQTEVVFPRGVTTVTIERPENLAALGAHAGEESTVVVVPVADPDAPTATERLAPVGTVAHVMDSIALPTGARRVTLHGLWRSPIEGLREENGRLEATARAAPAPEPPTEGLEAEVERILALVRSIAGLDPRHEANLAEMLSLNAASPVRLADLVAASLGFGYRDRTRLLCESDIARRFGLLIELLQEELARAEVHRGLAGKVDESRRRRYLRQQLEVIQRELGDDDPRELEARELERRLETSRIGPVARRRAERTLRQLRRTAHVAPEWRRMRAYLEWLLELPWPAAQDEDEGFAEDSPDPTEAFGRVMQTLDRSHSGLRSVKERIAEHLAVRQLGGAARGTVLCFSGPPGTGKSSMARAIAVALGREFVHVPVGGLTEEGELRGYPVEQEGSSPGAILQGIVRAGTDNPVVLIDEIDEVQFGSSGAAGGALLEILDRERNTEFLDHYLGVPYDLSQCIFLATANDTADMSEALLDRLEVIEFTGYTDSEKLTIAREHLIVRARERAGLEPWQMQLTPAALRTLMRNYTEEAGVRALMRLLYSLARKAAVEVVRNRRGLYVRKSSLLRLLGPALVDDDLRVRQPAIGICNGLAWTSTGGTLLPLEALLMPGGGRTILTGQIGEVLRESVQAAISYVRSRFERFGIAVDAFESLDMHLHFPSAATPKDGPSAGVAIVVGLISILSKRPVRHDVAMTGEISLHGEVLPVGGIRDKLLAAVRAGLHEVIVPQRNSQEILRLPAEIRRKLTVHLIDHVDEALELALLPRRRRPARRSNAAQRTRRARGA